MPDNEGEGPKGRQGQTNKNLINKRANREFTVFALFSYIKRILAKEPVMELGDTSAPCSRGQVQCGQRGGTGHWTEGGHWTLDTGQWRGTGQCMGFVHSTV